MLRFEGHAIVSVDGMIAGPDGTVPPALRNEADWRQYQSALDAAVLTVTGRRGHELNPNPGRRRLVVTRSVADLGPDPRDPRATLWNPQGLGFPEALAALGVLKGTVAITGLFDLFRPWYTTFQLSEMHTLVLPGGIPCFAAGHPRTVLTADGLRPAEVTLLDPAALVTTTRWTRPPSLDTGEANS
jgi:hypothetical protein